MHCTTRKPDRIGLARFAPAGTDYETKIESPAPGSTQINMWERPSQLAEVVPNKLFIRVEKSPTVSYSSPHR
jgi:hypothetical protein